MLCRPINSQFEAIPERFGRLSRGRDRRSGSGQTECLSRRRQRRVRDNSPPSREALWRGLAKARNWIERRAAAGNSQLPKDSRPIA
jgi:hypothetical protein